MGEEKSAELKYMNSGDIISFFVISLQVQLHLLNVFQGTY